MYDLSRHRQRCARKIERALDEFLDENILSGPAPAPNNLISAMRHGALDGGKRLRPLLLCQSAAIFGVNEKACLNAAMAVELVHCYSLVHDDLPAMDDDDLRRGRPTVHKAFNEATAILAGDALLTHAFGLLAANECHKDHKVRLRLITELVSGAGAGGMAGGQLRDLEGETTKLSDADITQMQFMKTGALICASVRMGAILGDANDDQLLALTNYARSAGLAFQLADDLLDLTASDTQMGKKTGKDANRNKPTYVSQFGVKAAKRHLGDTIHNAISALAMFGTEADGLRASARFFAERES